VLACSGTQQLQRLCVALCNAMQWWRAMLASLVTAGDICECLPDNFRPTPGVSLAPLPLPPDPQSLTTSLAAFLLLLLSTPKCQIGPTKQKHELYDYHPARTILRLIIVAVFIAVDLNVCARACEGVEKLSSILHKFIALWLHMLLLCVLVCT